jgi:hypothetical protein
MAYCSTKSVFLYFLSFPMNPQIVQSARYFKAMVFLKDLEKQQMAEVLILDTLLRKSRNIHQQPHSIAPEDLDALYNCVISCLIVFDLQTSKRTWFINKTCFVIVIFTILAHKF